MKKTIVLSSILFGIIICCFFLWESIFSSFLLYSLQSSCKKNWGITINAKEMNYVKGRWQLSQLSLTNKKHNCVAFADKAYIQYTFQKLFPRIELNIEKGELTLPLDEKVGFSLSANLGTDPSICFKVVDEKKQQSLDLISEKRNLSVYLSNINAQYLSFLTSLPFVILDGTVNGELYLQKNPHETITSGSISISNLLIDNNLQFSEIQISLHDNRGDFSSNFLVQNLFGPIAASGNFDLKNLSAAVSFASSDYPGLKANLTANLFSSSSQHDLDGVLEIGDSFSKEKVGFTVTYFSQQKEDVLGHIVANNIPLEKYIPTLFSFPEHWRLKGFANIKGSFDKKSLFLQYDLLDFSLDNEFFFLSLQDIGNSGSYYLNYSTLAHGGMIPIQKANCIEKKRGLHFTDLQGQLFFNPDEIHFNKAESICENFYLAGDLIFHYKDAQIGNADLCLHINTFNGALADLHYFSLPPFFKEIKNSNIFLRNEGAVFEFVWNSGKLNKTATVQGGLSDGFYSIPSSDISINDICLNFQYDHSTNIFTINDLQGALLVRPTKNMEEFTLSGDDITLNFETGAGHFDFWLGDRTRDLLRIEGKIVSGNDSGQKNCHLLDFNLEKTHFGNVHPKAFSLLLQDWDHIHKFDLQFEFSLQDLAKELQHLLDNGIISPPKYLSSERKNLSNCSGKVEFLFQYDENTSLCFCETKGQDIHWGNKSVKNLLLNAKKIHKSWSIDQLQCDDLTLSCEATPTNNNWRIHFLGIRQGKSILAGLEGDFFPSENSFIGKINLLEMDLTSLQTISPLVQFAKEYQPKGILRGTGTFGIHFKPEQPHWKIEAEMLAKLSHSSLADISFADIDAFNLNLNTSKELSFKNLHLQLLDNPEALFEIGEIKYLFPQQEAMVHSAKFHFPIASLPEAREKLSFHFPTLSRLLPTFAKYKPDGILEGTLQCKTSKHHYDFKVQCGGGDYSFCGTTLPLEDLMIYGNSFQVCAEGTYLWKKSPYLILFSTNSPEYKHGDFKIAQKNSNQEIAISWQEQGEEIFRIKKVEGQLAGITLQLNESSEHPSSLVGTIAIDMQKTDSLFPKQIKDILLSQNSNQIAFETVVDITEKECILRNLKSVNASNHFQATRLSINRSGDFSIHELKMKKYRSASVLVNDLELNLSGNIYALPIISGTGYLDATYTDKPQIGLAIPEELKESVTNLLPVEGKVFFNIEEGKILLNELKEVLSFDKTCKFFLAKKKTAVSSIGFNGDLSIQLKMKPQNLFHKLVEQYTLNISGTLEKPEFSLKK